MQWLARISVFRPVFAAVLMLGMTVVGLFAFPQLGVERYPNVDVPVVVVSTVVPGASPEEIESDVTEIIEQQVNTVPGIESLTSKSSEGLSTVTVTFQLEKNGDVAEQEVRAKLDLALPDLPKEAERPVVLKFRTSDIPILTFALSAPDASIRDLTEYARRTLRPQIESLRGVGEVAVVGGRERQVNVYPNPDRLAAFGLTLSDIQKALQSQNAQIPGGSLEQGAQRFSVRTAGRAESLAELRALAVKKRGGRVVRLSDVATVEDGEKDATNRANLDGKPAVLLNIRKQSGANTVAVADALLERMKEVRPTLPAGYELETVRDESVFVRASLHEVEKHLILGAVFAALVVLLFLRDFRSTVIAALAIPVSLITTFALMKAQGFSLNVLTLLALTLAVGIVIDDAILVLENIFRFLSEKGLSPKEAALEATQEIGLAVLATTLSLVAVFLPVAFIGGITGRFLASFGVTMTFAILVSLVVAFTATPMLSAQWLQTKEATHGGQKKDWISGLERGYGKVLHWSLRHRWVVVVACALTLASVIPLGGMANQTFLPAEDQGQFQINVRAPEGTTSQETERVLTRIAAEVRPLPNVRSTVVSVGEEVPNKGYILVGMEDFGERKSEDDQFAVMAKAREVVARYPRDLETAVIPSDAFSGGEAAVQFVLTGPDRARLTEAAEAVAGGLRREPGVASATTNAFRGSPELRVRIDRTRASDREASAADIASALRTLVAGEEVSRYAEGGRLYDIVLRARPTDRNRPARLTRFAIPSGEDGATVTLAEVVTLRRDSGAAEVSRYNRQPEVRIYVNPLPGASLETIRKKMESLYKAQQLPLAYRIVAEGDSKELEKTFVGFGLAFLMSVIFMYLILAAQFESWVHPVTILASLPLCVPFALIPLVVTGDSLNLFSLLGILVLFGIVKKNSILQVDHTNQLIARGLPRTQALIDASRDRLRPILMTTLAFVAGMVPLALSAEAGAATTRTIAVTIIGGQTLSLALTLIATPIIYSLLDDAGKFVGRLRGRFPTPKSVPPLLLLLTAVAGVGGAARAQADVEAPVVRSVDEAVATALARSPEVRAAGERARRANRAVVQSRSFRNPQVFAAATYNRLSNANAFGFSGANALTPGQIPAPVAAPPAAAPPGSAPVTLPDTSGLTRAARQTDPSPTDPPVTTGIGGGVDLNQSSLNLGVTQLVDITGAVGAGVSLARLDEELALLEVARVRQDLALSVRVACYELLRAEALTRVQSDALTRADEQLRVTTELRKEGVVPELNLLRARTERQAAYGAVLTARNSARIARSALAALMNVPAETVFTLTAPDGLPPLSDANADQLTRDAQAVRVEAVSARRSVERAGRGVRYARRTLEPSLSVGVTGSYNPGQAGVFVGGVGGQRGTATFNATLTVPLDDGGATRAAVDSARSEVAEAEIRLEQTLRGIAAEVEQTHVAVRDAAERLTVARGTVVEATKALEIARLRQSSGVGIYLEVLDAQAALTRAGASEASAFYDLLIADARLSRARGVTPGA